MPTPGTPSATVQIDQVSSRPARVRDATRVSPPAQTLRSAKAVSQPRCLRPFIDRVIPQMMAMAGTVISKARNASCLIMGPGSLMFPLALD